MIPLKIIFITLLLSYSSLVIYFLFKWNEIPFFKANCKNIHTTVSIIIPFRNEENNISRLINNLLRIDYPPLLYEIVLVDDNSTDNTWKIAEAEIERVSIKGVKIKLLNSEKVNKKGAIETGISSSAGELIITTDADCAFSTEWLKTIVCYYQQFDFDAASAPVMFKKEKNFWSQLQELEFISLISAGAASVETDLPIMCNGSNLIFKRSVFLEAGGYEGINNSASGDDVLFFQKLSKKKRKLSFIKAEDAIVTTSSASTFSEFIKQRKRWASKTTSHFYLPSFIVASVVYFFHFSILFTGIASFYSEELFKIFIFMFTIKIIVDFIFFNSALKFFKRKTLLFLILPAEIIYPFYIVVVGTLAPFGTYNWKGRSYK